jgi:hypothetical protein
MAAEEVADYIRPKRRQSVHRGGENDAERAQEVVQAAQEQLASTPGQLPQRPEEQRTGHDRFNANSASYMIRERLLVLRRNWMAPIVATVPLGAWSSQLDLNADARLRWLCLS